MRNLKPYEQLSATGRWVRDRQIAGLPLPPSMRRGTIDYVKSKGWNSLNQRCTNGSFVKRTRRNDSYLRRGTKLLFSKDQFDAWVESHWHEFNAFYSSGRTPSIDRIDNSKDYSIDNLQVIDLAVNMAKDRAKAIIATNVHTGEVREYQSGIAAARDGFDPRLIPRSIRRGMTHHGHKFKFKESP